jgi:NAD(P)H-dependent FMN reductase
MTKVLGISGSLRRGSYNTALLRAATRLMPPESTLEVAALRGIPLYDGDVEAQGIPATVTQLKEAIASADGVLLVTPEYNNSIPGVFKNAIDWCSRPSDIKRVFGGRRCADALPELRHHPQPGGLAAGAVPSAPSRGSALGCRCPAPRRCFDESGTLK